MFAWKQAKCTKTEVEPKQMIYASVLVQFGLHNPDSLTKSELCNLETSFPTPFVDFQRGDLQISDYIIRILQDFWIMFSETIYSKLASSFIRVVEVPNSTNLFGI